MHSDNALSISTGNASATVGFFLGNVTNNSIPQVLSPSPGQDLFGTKEPDFMVLLGLSVLGVPFAIKLLDILADRFLNSQSDVRDLQANLKQFPKSQAFFLNQFIQEFSESRGSKLSPYVVKALLNVSNLAMLGSYFSQKTDQQFDLGLAGCGLLSKAFVQFVFSEANFYRSVIAPQPKLMPIKPPVYGESNLNSDTVDQVFNEIKDESYPWLKAAGVTVATTIPNVIFLALIFNLFEAFSEESSDSNDYVLGVAMAVLFALESLVSTKWAHHVANLSKENNQPPLVHIPSNKARVVPEIKSVFVRYFEQLRPTPGPRPQEAKDWVGRGRCCATKTASA